MHLLDKILHKSPPSPEPAESPEQADRRRHRHDAERARELRQAELNDNLHNFEEAVANDPSGSRYGLIEHSGAPRTVDLEGRPRTPLSQVDSSKIGQTVLFRARIHSSRSLSSKLAFIVFRYQLHTIQGVLRAGDSEAALNGSSNGDVMNGESAPAVSHTMVRWAEKLPAETIVLCEGVVQRPSKNVDSVLIHDAEIKILKLHVVSEVTGDAPFQPALIDTMARKHDEDSEGHHPGVGFSNQLRHRPISLRTADAHAIFKLQAAFSRAARTFLEEQGFMEIHSAKLGAGATESGASVFKVSYFGRDAFLAQSPQLAKEMCIGADMHRVYEIGPVFRAENSNTHRHLTEYVGVDLEMAIDLHYHEAMHMIDNLLKFIFKTVSEKNRLEIETVKVAHPSEDLVWLDETPVLTFAEGVKLLLDSGWDEDPPDMDDLSTRAEVRLGQLVKEKYKTDYYILDKFPASARPFYTMPSADDPKISNSFDIFVRGEEILSGGQRLHSATALKKALKKAHIPETAMKEYIESFSQGMPPHAGGGIGLERLVMLFLKLGNIRYSSLMPRDPHSFPRMSQREELDLARAAEESMPTLSIAGWTEEDVLSQDDMKKDHHPALTDLIAKYGDSTSTAFSDKGYALFREEDHGWVIGYNARKGHAITWAAPLCPETELKRVISAYLKFLDKKHLKPIWLNADERTEKILAEQMNWKALAVTTEQRIDPTMVRDSIESDRELAHKIQTASNHGVHVELIEGEMSEELRHELEEGIHAWQEHRQEKGSQVHTTQVRIFSDAKHRTYMLARDKEKKVVGVLVLHHLSVENGLQIKWSLEFPDAPSGTSELLVSSAMKEMADRGIKTATFGAGARDKLDAVAHVGKLRSKMLSSTYSAISKTFKLSNKTGYRRKFGAGDTTLYVLYPKIISPSGIEAIMSSVKSDEKSPPSTPSAKPAIIPAAKQFIKTGHDEKHVNKVNTF